MISLSMSLNHPALYKASCVFFVTCAICLYGAFASGQSVTYEIRGIEPQRRAVAPLVERSGIAYISLSSLIRDLGGEWSVREGQIRVELLSNAVNLTPGDRRISGGPVQVTLHHPVIFTERQIWMASRDVPIFFEQGMNIFLTTQTDIREQDIGLDPDSLLATDTDTETISRRPRVYERNVQVIIIDPGHGGSDSGLVGSGGLLEKTVSLAVATRLSEILANRLDAQILLTRTEDVDLPSRARARFVEVYNGDLYISLHVGSSPTPETHGFAVFHVQSPLDSDFTLSRDNTALAAAVFRSLHDETGSSGLGVYEAPLRALTGMSVPAILVELGCITNTEEEELLADKTYQDKLAQGIATGVFRFIGVDTPGSTS